MSFASTSPQTKIEERWAKNANAFLLFFPCCLSEILFITFIPFSTPFPTCSTQLQLSEANVKVHIFSDLAAPLSESDVLPPEECEPNTLAYIMYTSGIVALCYEQLVTPENWPSKAPGCSQSPRLKQAPLAIPRACA